MIVRALLSAAAATIGLAAASVSFAGDAPGPAVVAAVADTARPAADRERDADRKPAEIIAFAGISPGYKVAEVAPGGGYFTRIFSKVVGEKGVVYALQAPPRPNATTPPAINAIAADPQYGNVKVEVFDPDPSLVKLPEQVDVVWTSLNYHDFHNRPNADLMAFNKMALAALKPGGNYIVIDHAAQNGSGKRDTGTLHRIDPELVMNEVKAAGFEFVRESPLLAHPADDRSKPMSEVDRGKTDQFIYMFRKPQ
jgi:predicted methyltransferase